MATPTPTRYSVPHGATCYGGKSAPVKSILDYVPAPGQLKSVHLNDLAALNACPGDACWYSENSKQNGPWAQWTGAVFAPDYSTYGAMVYWGGGHGGYDGTEFYIFDLTTQKWSRLGGTPATDFIESVAAPWCDYIDPATGDPVAPASHTYNMPVYLGPSYGGGAKGSWCLPCNNWGPNSQGVSGAYQPHAVDLQTGRWSRLTNNVYAPYVPSSFYGACFVDTKRNRLWGMAGVDTNAHCYIDLTAASKTITPYSAVYTSGYNYASATYVEAKDVMVALWVDGNKNAHLAIYDLATGLLGAPVNPANYQTVSIGTGSGVGFEWCPDTGKFYCYEGQGVTYINVLTPPASGDWINGAWSWSKEYMGGETPVNILTVSATSGQQTFSKFRYNSKLKCFMWSQGTNTSISPDGVNRTGAFQLYRPLGT